MSENNNFNDPKEEPQAVIQTNGQGETRQLGNPDKKESINSFGKKVIIFVCIIFAVALLVLLVSCLVHKNDLKYTTKSLSYVGDMASAVVEVENNTNNYVSYTLDLQIWDRYGDLVGYQYMTIRLDPHTKKEFEIVARCTTWDLEGSKGEVRVY